MRISHMTTALMSIALALAISLAAAAQTSATSPSPQSEPATAPSSSAQPQGEPAQAAPAQSEPAQAAPSQPSMSPSQSGASAQAGQGQAQAHAQSQGEEENPLNLTDEQKAKLRPIVADETHQLDAVRNDSSLSAEQKVAKANQIRETASPKIKAILTPEQLQKLADMQQKARQQQGAPSNDSQKPQQ
jgi:protein CpxP